MSEASDEQYEMLYIPRDGVKFDPRDPDPDKMSIESIAHGLAYEFRYGNHTDPLVNVAQHSVDTADLLEEQGYGPEIQFYGLHHDSNEAYIGDNQKPLKVDNPILEEVEDIWQDTVWDFLGINAPDDEQHRTVKMADSQLYLYESKELYKDEEHSEDAEGRVDSREWDMSPEEVIDYLGKRNWQKSPEESKTEFLEMHEDLVSKI